MERIWLLTWTTYGTWLPGDRHGSVASVREGLGPRREKGEPNSPVEPPMPGLETASRDRMKGAPLFLDRARAEVVLTQFHETAAYRGWKLLGAALMASHVHLVLTVPGDPEPELLLRDFKSYASRALNGRFGKPLSGTWWTTGGSTRKLPDASAVERALVYVRNQHAPLTTWFAE